MKKMTAFFTIALLVCIATFVAFASNQNRDVSHTFLTLQGTDEDFPGGYSDEDNTGTDSEGPLYCTASSWFGYYHNDNGDFKCSASAYAYVSCSTTNLAYRTTYTLYAEVPELIQNPNIRNPQTLPREGSFSDSVSRDGEANGEWLNMGGANASTSAFGKDPIKGDQHTASAATPTPATARVLEIICKYCNNGCSLCD